MLTSAITPYCGFKSKHAGGQIYVPRSAPHVLVSAPTEGGKTRRILAPAAVLWGGPAVVVSPTDELLQYVIERRWGPKALIDMRPISTPVYLHGLDTLGWDPTITTGTPQEALAVAETILQTVTLARGWGDHRNREHGVWESRAAGPLAALLYAASPAGNSQGIEWVLRAVDNSNPHSSDEPGWRQAISICQSVEILTLGLRRILELDEPRVRDLVALTMRAALTPWLYTMCRPEAAKIFDPQFLDDPQATLFVLAPADGTVTACAVALLDSLIRRWRDKTAARAPMERLLVVVDDLPNTAPILNLRRVVSEGGGLGVNVVAGVQASSQLGTVYGSACAAELRDIFPAAVIMYGAREADLLAAAESWSGLTVRHPETYSQADGHSYLHSELGAGLRWQELLPRNRDEARLLVRGTLGSSVQVPDWTVFRAHYDGAVRHLLSSGHSRNGSGGVSVVEMLQRWWRVDADDPSAHGWAAAT